jgi:hypothetical protein
MKSRLILTVAVIVASIAGSALASPDASVATGILHFRPGPEWRAYWVCARRATKVMTNKDLSAQVAFSHVEALCSAEKAAFLLAQIDNVPRDQRVKMAGYVDLVCVAEAMGDILSIEVYRGQSGGVGSAPSTWDDPNDPLNRWTGVGLHMASASITTLWPAGIFQMARA